MIDYLGQRGAQGVVAGVAATVQRLRFDGTVLATFETRLVVDRLAAAIVALPERITSGEDRRGEFLLATTAAGERALWFFAEGKALSLTADVVTTVVTSTRTVSR